MSRPLVSICATVYNNKDRVRASLNSVINQFPDFSKNFEFVIVDNFSDDDTYEILKEFASKYKNIRVYRAHCTRGKGRDVALRKAHGEYIFYVDLDTIYYPTLSKLVYGSLSKYKKWTDSDIITSVIKRSTLIRLGGWRDLQTSEDTELSARAIRQGIKFLLVPVKVGENEAVKKEKFRIERYSKGGYKKFKLLLKIAEDTIRGNGINRVDEIRARKVWYNLAFKLIYLKIKLQRKKIYRYCKRYNNSKYIALNMHFVSPILFNIPKKFWIYSMFIDPDNNPNYKEKISLLRSFGFDRIKYTNTGFIILYNHGADSKILNNELNFLNELRITIV